MEDKINDQLTAINGDYKLAINGDYLLDVQQEG